MATKPDLSKNKYKFVGGPPTTFEITVAVPDITVAYDKAKYLFGWEPYNSLPPPRTYNKCRDLPLPDNYFRGQKVEGTQALLYYRGGPIRFEFMEGTRGDSVYADFTRRHKRMLIQHIGCRVTDQAAELAEIKARGMDKIANIAGGTRDFKIAYLDSEDQIGFNWELVQADGEMPGTNPYDDTPETSRDYRFMNNQAYVFEVGVVCPDLEAAMANLKKHFDWTPDLVIGGPVPHNVFRGKEVTASARMASYKFEPIVPSHPLRWIFIEGTKGDSIYADFAKRHKRMLVQHVACRVSNLDAELSRLAKRGVGVVSTQGGYECPFKAASLDTEELLGFNFELVEGEPFEKTC